MAKRVTRYESATGSLHQTLEAALRADREALTNKLGQFMDSAFPHAHKPSVLQAVDGFIASRAELAAMMREILELLDALDGEAGE